MSRFRVLAATLVVIGTNTAATLLPINGLATGEISALYPTGFTPAGWVFSIWSLIYLGLLAYGVHAAQLGGRAARSANTRLVARLRAIEPAYLASCAANTAWIFLWHYRHVGASVVAMAVLLAGLVVVYVQLRRRPPPPGLQRVIVDGTFSLYLGWITTATFANLGAWFFATGDWPFALTMDQTALVAVVLATGLYIAAGMWTADAIYTTVFVWAALGIVYRASGISEPVRLAAATGAVAVAVVTLLSIARTLSGHRRSMPG